MRGTPKQVEIAEGKKRVFMALLDACQTVDVSKLDTPTAKRLKATRERIENAPASWWLDFISKEACIDTNEVYQVMAAVAQNKPYAVEGID